jgi:Mor family transcriptional regulator
MKTAKPERNASLVADRDGGATFVSLALKYKISMGRVREIYYGAKHRADAAEGISIVDRPVV